VSIGNKQAPAGNEANAYQPAEGDFFFLFVLVEKIFENRFDAFVAGYLGEDRAWDWPQLDTRAGIHRGIRDYEREGGYFVRIRAHFRGFPEPKNGKDGGASIFGSGKIGQE
jgi:hypothetical protein